MNIVHISGGTLTLGECAEDDKVHPDIDKLTDEEREDFLLDGADEQYIDMLRDPDVIWSVLGKDNTEEEEWGGNNNTYTVRGVSSYGNAGHPNYSIVLPAHTPATRV